MRVSGRSPTRTSHNPAPTIAATAASDTTSSISSSRRSVAETSSSGAASTSVPRKPIGCVRTRNPGPPPAAPTLKLASRLCSRSGSRGCDGEASPLSTVEPTTSPAGLRGLDPHARRELGEALEVPPVREPAAAPAAAPSVRALTASVRSTRSIRNERSAA